MWRLSLNYAERFNLHTINNPAHDEWPFTRFGRVQDPVVLERLLRLLADRNTEVQDEAG